MTLRVPNALFRSFIAALRSKIRRAGRRLFGPNLFDSVVQFHRIPSREDVLSQTRNRRCVFLEPHFDDVAFSCGGLFAQLEKHAAEAGSKTQVILLTAFTEGPERGTPLSPLARQLHEEWGEAEQPYKERRQEARSALEALNVSSRWLNLKDVLYRDSRLTSSQELLQPEADSIGDPYDQDVVESVKEGLDDCLEESEQTSAKDRPTVVFAPLGVGGHRDHRLVHTAVREYKAEQRSSALTSFWFYEDFPYVQGIVPLKRRIRQIGKAARPTTVDIRSTIESRIQLSSRYASQVKSIFGSKEQMRRRIRNYASFVGTPACPRERFWKL